MYSIAGCHITRITHCLYRSRLCQHSLMCSTGPELGPWCCSHSCNSRTRTTEEHEWACRYVTGGCYVFWLLASNTHLCWFYHVCKLITSLKATPQQGLDRLPCDAHRCVRTTIDLSTGMPIFQKVYAFEHQHALLMKGNYSHSHCSLRSSFTSHQFPGRVDEVYFFCEEHGSSSNSSKSGSSCADIDERE